MRYNDFMDEKSFLLLILGAVISADVVALLIQNFLFEKRFKKFEQELAHKLERDLIGFKWAHDRRRTAEEELLRVCTEAQLQVDSSCRRADMKIEIEETGF